MEIQKNHQIVRVNVRDVDTFELIEKDFRIFFYPNDYATCRTVKYGTTDMPIINDQPFANIQVINKADITSYGYDPLSWSGNYITFKTVQEDGRQWYVMPSEINLYLKKLA